MTRTLTEAFYLSHNGRALFCLLICPPPDLAVRGELLHVPAFADEMNKSRRVVATTARGLAEVGWRVMVLDPHGTGDSGGDFGEASWEGWIEDVCFAYSWLADRSGTTPVLWGLRAGCLLINDALTRLACKRVVFWQPAISGDAALMQFLRLSAMRNLAKADAHKQSTRSLMSVLEMGTAVEVAGYLLAPSLALPFRKSRLCGPAYAGVEVLWVEVSSAEPAVVLPASAARAEELLQTGAAVRTQCVRGRGFWMTQEIDECSALVETTVAALSTQP